MKRHMRTTDDTSKAVVFIILITGFEMIRIVQRLSNKVPLKRRTVSGIYATHFVGAPAHTAMIDDHVFIPGAAECVVSTVAIYLSIVLKLVAHPKPEKPDND